ncbi:MAG: hypothetical protein DRG30_03120 [Epsilonproteobacteria bacterium]|nr:MAG: hypothetical protein DRG30_03120 [Campylobacterota bacterium]
MQLLQGGTQSELRKCDNFIIAVSELGVSVYRLDTNISLGYCLLTGTVSADIHHTGVYICSTSEIYFLPINSLSGDSTASLQLLSITPSGSIVKLCAEKKYLSYITSTEVCVVKLSDLSSRFLSLPGVLYLDSYTNYIAFATNTNVYTFCAFAQDFSLSNCFTPCKRLEPSIPSLTLKNISQGYFEGAGENIIYATDPSLGTYTGFVFGDYIEKNSLVGANVYRNDATTSEGVYLRWSILHFPSPTGVHIEFNLPLVNSGFVGVSYKNFYYSYSDDTIEITFPNGKLSSATIGEVMVKAHPQFRANYSTSGIYNNQAISVEYGGAYIYFTLPVPNYEFRMCQVASLNGMEQGDKIYGWGYYSIYKDGDPAGTYNDRKLALFIYNKVTLEKTVIQDPPFRSEVMLAILDEVNGGINAYPGNYFSTIYAWNDFYVKIDSYYTMTEWGVSGVAKRIDLFTLDDSTDTFTTLASYDWPCAAGAHYAPIVNSTWSNLYLYRDYELQVLTASVIQQIDYLDISAISYKGGLAVASTGEGINTMGITGFWPQWFPTTEEVLSLDLEDSQEGETLLAYATATESRVIDI